MRKTVLLFMAIIIAVTTVFTACDDSASNTTNKNNSSQSTANNNNQGSASNNNQGSASNNNQGSASNNNQGSTNNNNQGSASNNNQGSTENNNQGSTNNNNQETTKPCTHQYTSKVTAEATCGREGIKTYTCSLCGSSYTEEIPMLEYHKWSPRTCITKGTCKVCGKLSGYAACEYDDKGTCTVCKKTAVKVILPSGTQNVTYDRYITQTCQITSLDYKIRITEYTEGVECVLTISGYAKCTFMSRENYSTAMKIGLKIYDENNVVVESDTIYTPALTVGETVKFEKVVYHLPLTSQLKIEILNVG